jgi:hypothetical protein
MNIKEIAERINALSKDYQFGKLQEYRKRYKSLDRKPTNDIFYEKTIFDDYAFHAGGRKEIQYNIGFENKNKFRYGLAFSLELSQGLNDISILFPNILRLNQTIREKPELFKDYELWYYSENGRSKNSIVHEIPKNWIHEGNFIFFGKLVNITNIDYNEIVLTFNDMLIIYFEVENINIRKVNIGTNREKFIFNNGKIKLVEKRNYTSVERNTNISIRHSIIQSSLYKILSEQYGENNVGLENNINGGKIDVVVKDNDEYIFYEIKTGNNAASCIRQALGQLFEYAFYPGKQNAKKIVVVGEQMIDNETNSYLNYLKNTFNIPIEYMCVKI